jgi:hypothetical protein
VDAVQAASLADISCGMFDTMERLDEFIENRIRCVIEVFRSVGVGKDRLLTEDLSSGLLIIEAKIGEVKHWDIMARGSQYARFWSRLLEHCCGLDASAELDISAVFNMKAEADAALFAETALLFPDIFHKASVLPVVTAVVAPSGRADGDGHDDKSDKTHEHVAGADAADSTSSIDNGVNTAVDAELQTLIAKVQPGGAGALSTDRSVVQLRSEITASLSSELSSALNLQLFMKKAEAMLYEFYAAGTKDGKDVERILPDVGTDKIFVDVGSGSERLYLRAGEAVDRRMRLVYCGRVTMQPTAQSLPLCSCWGVDFYVDGTPHRSAMSDVFVPAWAVPLAKAVKGTKPVKQALASLELNMDSTNIKMCFQYAHQGKMITKAVVLKLHYLCTHLVPDVQLVEGQKTLITRSIFSDQMVSKDLPSFLSNIS